MQKKFLRPALIAIALGLASTSAGANMRPTTLMGEIVPLSAATRTIVILPKTKYVNVTENEAVKFTSNGAEFAVIFAGIRSGWDLNLLAPAGALDHEVTVYVAPNAFNSGGA